MSNRTEGIFKVAWFSLWNAIVFLLLLWGTHLASPDAFTFQQEVTILTIAFTLAIGNIIGEWMFAK